MIEIKASPLFTGNIRPLALRLVIFSPPFAAMTNWAADWELEDEIPTQLEQSGDADLLHY
jgi:hypothetical protein